MSSHPSCSPTLFPTHPTESPSEAPSGPSQSPSCQPSTPTAVPSLSLTCSPSISSAPKAKPSMRPSVAPSIVVTEQRSGVPTTAPTFVRTGKPSTMRPSIKPSLIPTKKTTHEPSRSTGYPTVSESVNITVIVEGGKYEGGVESHNLFIVQPVALSRVEIEGGGQMNTYRIRSEGVRDVIVVIRDFDESKDVLDLRLFSDIRSMDELSYTSPPLTLALPNNIKVMLVSSVPMNLRVDQNILLTEEVTDTSGISDHPFFFDESLITASSILLALSLLTVLLSFLNSLFGDEDFNHNDANVANDSNEPGMKEGTRPDDVTQEKGNDEDLTFDTKVKAEINPELFVDPSVTGNVSDHNGDVSIVVRRIDSFNTNSEVYLETVRQFSERDSCDESSDSSDDGEESSGSSMYSGWEESLQSFSSV
eukprot:gene13383-14711_t